ncbi:hypothetical protein HKBW3S09_01955, partial [Candidatus Hakubella thermalkaliphila]
TKPLRLQEDFGIKERIVTAEMHGRIGTAWEEFRVTIRVVCREAEQEAHQGTAGGIKEGVSAHRD